MNDLWNFQKILETFSACSEKNKQWMQQTFQSYQQKITDHNIKNIMLAWQEFIFHILKKPEKLIINQFNFYQSYLKLCHELNQNIQNKIEEKPSYSTSPIDRRFIHDEWDKNYLFNFIKQSYLLFSENLHDLIKDIANESEHKEVKKIEFYIRQFIDAMSPTNFISTNPEVLQETLNSQGKNLMNGFKEFCEDYEKSHRNGLFTIKTTDLDSFEIGKNIAMTAGKVIYQNDIMQLIQYLPLTSKVNQHPLLIVPPWINKYYIFDLQPENSFVRWLLEQGQTVFLISWVNPDNTHSEKQFSAYLVDGPLTALKIIEKVTHEKKINTLGYCIGGTLLAFALAYLNQKKNNCILSATFLTTLLDFSSPGDLGVFVDESQITAIENLMEEKGFLDGHILMSTFNMLRSNDLIWKNFINNYLKGKKPAAFDLLYWNSDPTNIPKKVHSFYLREMYLNNKLVQPNSLKMRNVPIDLSQVTVPSYFLAAQDDHIVPWISCFQGLKCIGGEKKFVLADSGHVSGVINSPHRNKYGYRTSLSLKHDDWTEWLNNANHVCGSWWVDWYQWLNENFSGKKIVAREINSSKSKVIEDAPGWYVKKRLNQ